MQKPFTLIQLNPHQPIPVYQQIAQTLRDRIARGELRAGDALPTVRALAQQLKLNQNTVNRAYRLLRREGLLDTHGSQGTCVADLNAHESQRAVHDAELHLTISRLIGEATRRGFTLAEIEAAFVAQRARWQAQHDFAHTPSEARILGLGSDDLCLELLLTQFPEVHPKPHLSFTVVGSLAGLMALARGEAHFAAAHLYDAEADDYNAPFVRRLMAGQSCALITLAQREQGLIVAKGNPKKIHDVRDLARRGVRFVNRQRGAGTRVLLDGLLQRARIAQREVHGYTHEEPTHSAVASAVASGAADAGLGIQAAARSFALDFAPITQERFELILLRHAPEIELFLSVINRPAFKQVAESLGGYNLTELGRVRYT